MESHGVIIRHLRTQNALSVQKTAELINRSVGWLSEIENQHGTARISEKEFARIVDILGGAQYSNQFKTWVASAKNRNSSAKKFDGAVLKYIREKCGYSLHKAKALTGYSVAYLSMLESGKKDVSLELRIKIMTGYGYSPSSFKNLSTDPVRSKAVPSVYKLEILLKKLSSKNIDDVFQYALDKFENQNSTKENNHG